MFDTETEAARAYDTALWRLKPREARNYANFKDTCPPDVEELLASMEKVSQGLVLKQTINSIQVLGFRGLCTLTPVIADTVPSAAHQPRMAALQPPTDRRTCAMFLCSAGHTPGAAPHGPAADGQAAD
jgi:hypothetical protein